MLVDTHCHLDAAEFNADRDGVIRAAIAAGVGRMVVPGVERANLASVETLASAYPEIRVAYGVHPMYTDRAADDDVAVVRGYLARGGAVAVGEIGLDFFVAHLDGERQMHFFIEQLKLAQEFNLPVILHIRRAQDLILKCLRKYRVRGGIAHAFNGSQVQADAFIKLGFKLGFGGAMTYPRALRIRGLAQSLPLESIVLETDSPDIPPEWIRGQRNDPSNLIRIAAELAQLRGLGVDEVIRATYENACAALPGLSA